MAVIDEKKQVDEIIKTGDVGSKPMSSVYLLVKYYFSLGMDKIQVRDEIESFLENNVNGYNEVKWADRIENTINMVAKHKYGLIVVEKIVFTDTEMNAIETLPSEPLKRLAFVILYHAKLTKAKYDKEGDVWLNDGVGSYCRMAKIYGKKDDKILMMSKLQDFGLLTQGKSIKEFTYKVDYILEGEVAIVIEYVVDEKNDILLHYKRWKGSKIIDCEDCGSLIDVKSKFSNISYCKKCSKKRQQLHEKNSKNKQKMTLASKPI